MGQEKIIPVVLDTNVIVSALLFGGTPGKLMALWKSGCIQPFLCKEIIEETLRVLAYPRFRLSEEEINYLLYYEILPYFEVVGISPGPVIVAQDPSDDKFIRCAEAAGAGVIISGDRHLISLKEYGSVKILTPARFLAGL
ncbi:MAG: putative toxin-antitoxin system toxin component, PIN family [Pseudomonadota bacterium]